MPGGGGTGALLSVVVFGIDLGQFLQTTPCERRFRTDAQLVTSPIVSATRWVRSVNLRFTFASRLRRPRARPHIGSHWSFVRIKACSSYVYRTRAGEKE